MNTLKGVRLNGSRSTSVSAKSVLPVIQDEVRSEAVFDIESSRQRKFGVLPCPFVILNESIGLYDKKSSASDFGYSREFSCLRDLRESESSPVGAPKILFILSPNESLQIQTPNHRVW